MDTVTTAIITALAAGAGSGATDVAKKAIVDGYEGLKALLKKKFGSDSELAEAVEKLETKPDSTGRQQTLAEESAGAKATTDPEVLAAAQTLLAQIQAKPGGEQLIQKIIGNYNAAVQGSGTASVHISSLPDKKDV